MLHIYFSVVISFIYYVMAQGQYPETLGHTIVVNTSFIFPYVWSMIKPLIDPVSAKKIHVMSSEEEWAPVVGDLLGVENVSSTYSGSLPALDVSIHPYAEAVNVGSNDGQGTIHLRMCLEQESEPTPATNTESIQLEIEPK